MLHERRRFSSTAGLISVLITLWPVWALKASVDLTDYRIDCGIQVREQGGRLTMIWPSGGNGSASLSLQSDPKLPLFQSIGMSPATGGAVQSILTQVDPVYFLTVGSRTLGEQGWNIFFDNPPRRAHQRYRATLRRDLIKVSSRGRQATVSIGPMSAGPFLGELQVTVYRGCPLVQVTAAMSTEQEATAYLYDTGLSSPTPSWTSISWRDTRDQFQVRPTMVQSDPVPIAVRLRTVIAEGEHGSLAVFPPPHQYLYPLDFANNFALTWHGRGYQQSGEAWSFGVRQPPDGDGRYVPWINAPPKSLQRMSVFYLLSNQSPEKAFDEVARFTHGDRFPKLPGHHTFTSHFHVEHTLDYLKQKAEQQTEGVPRGLEEPGFVKTFKAHGVDIVHLAEFHVRHSPEFIKQRLIQLKTLHDECRRLSNESFLLLPGEEPNVHLGGHWISFFPRPVYWRLHPTTEQPFREEVEGYGTVYSVRTPQDILRIMELEEGLMWTAHARTKSSFGFPDRYRESEFYRSPHFLGAAWKAMPADLSVPRLGSRVLDLFNDMANWGQQKYVLGEVDVFKVMPDYELYGHMNINYLQLDRIPRFDDGWHPVLSALRNGKFFVSTGEILISGFRVGGQSSGDRLSLNSQTQHELQANLSWTFPPSRAEIILGDGKETQRIPIDLSEHSSFGSTELRVPVELKGKKWVRLEVWDIATNGAFTQPVWLE